MRAVIRLLIYLALLTKASQAEENWWQFRGPSGDGHAQTTDLPTIWSEQTNVAWKTQIHDRGWSSPVIVGNQIWLTTALESGRKLFAVCVDKKTGHVIHDIHVFDVDNPMKITSENTYATPTPVVKNGRVIVHYGTYGTACLDTKSGRKIWARRDLKCDHEANAGPASSPTIIDDTVVVHVDGRDVQYIVALNLDNGRTVWKTQRSIDFSQIPVHHRKAYSMPSLAARGDTGLQLISPAGRALYSYEPKTGRELWRVQHRGWSVAPRPVSGHGLIFATIDRDSPELWAIRGDGNGDVTDTHIQWKETKSMPQRCSPLLVDDLLFLVNRRGIATCLEAKTGQLVWKERLEGAYSASPIYIKNRIYLFSESGTTTIIRPARKFEVVATNQLASEQLMATPAVDGKALIIRTLSHLYRIEEGAQRTSRPNEHPESAHANFVGRWAIGNPSKPAFIMTLNADGSAKKSHVPKSTGKWQVVDGEARVVWSEGWRDIIRPENKKFRKIAFRPGTDFDSPPSNTDSASKLD